VLGILQQWWLDFNVILFKILFKFGKNFEFNFTSAFLSDNEEPKIYVLVSHIKTLVNGRGATVHRAQ
jgi:hypothetical protein